MFIYITGASGAGKSTLVRSVAECTGATPLGGSSAVMAFHSLDDPHFFQEHLIACYDDWFIPYERYYHYKESQNPSQYYLLDLHFHYFRYNGDLRRTTQSYDVQNLKCVILLEPPLEVIQERRSNDLDIRPDRSTDIQTIRHEVRAERRAATDFAWRNRVLLISLQNLELERSIKTVINQMA
jgi:adenylate kinase